MDWQTTGNILFGLGAIALLVGLLLRFRIGRWLLAGLWLVLTLGSLLSGDWHALDSNPDVGNDLQKASNYWLLGGSLGLLVGWALSALSSPY